MAFNVNEFIHSMTKDGARPNLFEISITGIQTFRCKASAIPGSSIGMAVSNYFGRPVKFAGTRVFSDWTVSVLVDEDDFNSGSRASLEEWMNAINSHYGNKRAENFVAPTQYQRDGVVTQFGKDGSIIAKYHMRHCFPMDVGAIPLDWGNNNAIMEFPVTFAMNYWERFTIVEDADQLNDPITT